MEQAQGKAAITTMKAAAEMREIVEREGGKEGGKDGADAKSRASLGWSERLHVGWMMSVVQD
jgi:hypothetical protein